MKYKLPCGYTLRFEGIGLHVEKTGSPQVYFQNKGKESGLPARVEVITGRGTERKCLLLSEKDFLAGGAKRDRDGLGFRVTGRCRGLALTQSVRCSEVKVGGRKLLEIARRLTLEIESVEFTAPEYVRLLMLTRWGGKGKGRSFELSANNMNFGVSDRFPGWVSPCLYDADGPFGREHYCPTNVHTVGFAECTVLSWPKKRSAVMVAIDPVEYVKRGINPDSAQRGPAQAAFAGWFRPEDRGLVHETFWQHYYLLDEEEDPLITTAQIWRDRHAKRLNRYLQPLEELEPWFATEMLLGPRTLEGDGEPWDGNLTGLEEHYAALRADPLDGQIHPILMHERPGFSGIFSFRNRYNTGYVEIPGGSVTVNVPSFHQTGDLFTIYLFLNLTGGPIDSHFEFSVSGGCFRFEGVSLVPFKRKTRTDASFAPERLNVSQNDERIGITVGHSAQSLASDMADYKDFMPVFEVRLRVTREIRGDEGVVEAAFLHRKASDDPYTRVPLLQQKAMERGAFTFPPEQPSLRIRSGRRPSQYTPLFLGPRETEIFYEVEDGRPVLLKPEELGRKLGLLMRKYDVAITMYVPAYAQPRYDYCRNPDYLVPNALALDEDGRPRERWYTPGKRSDEQCPACAENNEKLYRCLEQFLSWGPYGIYVDELCGGPGSCFAREHGHGLSRHQRLSHLRVEGMRSVARRSGYPQMYIGTEGGNLLQHISAQGHNYVSINPSRRDYIDQIKLLVLCQVGYHFPGGRAYFNYCYSGNPKTEDYLFGNVIGLAFPRFALAPFSVLRHQVSRYFACAVKRAFPGHYRYGQTEFDAEPLRPGVAQPDMSVFVLRSAEGVSVHAANYSDVEKGFEKEGYAGTVGGGCAVLVDSFGNILAETDRICWKDADYIRLDRRAAFGLWRDEDGAAYIQALELDRTSLKAPVRFFLSEELLVRLKISEDKKASWFALDAKGKRTHVAARALDEGVELLYPDDPACRCVSWPVRSRP